MKLDNGSSIKLRGYGGQVIDIIVVSETKTHVAVCLSEEWLRATRERRTPDCVGFHKSDIVQVNETEFS
jgi:hypothetical protein